MNLQNKFRGCFIGLAVGDALGSQVEFSSRPVNPEQFITYKPNKIWNIPAGGWTDDTAQALCLAEGLLAGDTDTQLMDRFIKWMEEGYNACSGKAVGIGGTTLKTLMAYRVTGQIKPPTDEHSAGNGCIMRLAPVVLYNYSYKKFGDIFGIYTAVTDECKRSCKLTHGSELSVICTEQFGFSMCNALDGFDKNIILSSIVKVRKCDAFNSIVNGEFKTKTADGEIEHKFGNTYYSEAALKSDGFCINTLECAFWAFWNSESFEEGMIKAISLGGDTDTIGAVYGQLAGAYYGYSNIPKRWRDGLMQHDRIVGLADQLGGY